jgi:hypothetical protein
MIITHGDAQMLRAFLDMLGAQRLDVERIINITIARGEVCRLLGERKEAKASYTRALEYLEAFPTTVCWHIGALLERVSLLEALVWYRRGWPS